MKKLMAMIGGAALVAGGAVGVAVAHPGPHHGNNVHGLCTAYFNGSENGQANKRKAGPFVELERVAKEYDDANGDEYDEAAQEVWRFCMDAANNPKGIGGNPDDPNIAGNEGNGKNGRGNG